MESPGKNNIPASLVELDYDDEVQQLKIKRKAKEMTKAKALNKEENDDRLLWTTEVLNKFLDAMVEQVNTGHRTTTTFSKEGWSLIVNELKDHNINKIQCINKFNKLREEYTSFKKLSQENGVAVNLNTGTARAKDSVWIKLKKVIKGCSRFCKNGCPYYPKLHFIFGDRTTIGGQPHPSTKVQSESDNDDDSDNEDDDDSSDGLQVLGHEEGDECVEVENVKRVKRVVIEKEGHLDSFASSIESFMQQMTENSKKRTQILEKHFVQAPKISETVGDNCVKANEDLAQFLQSVDLLSELDNIDGPSFAKCVKVLREDPYMRAAFLRLPRERRKDFVIYL